MPYRRRYASRGRRRRPQYTWVRDAIVPTIGLADGNTFNIDLLYKCREPGAPGNPSVVRNELYATPDIDTRNVFDYNGAMVHRVHLRIVAGWSWGTGAPGPDPGMGYYCGLSVGNFNNADQLQGPISSSSSGVAGSLGASAVDWMLWQRRPIATGRGADVTAGTQYKLFEEYVYDVRSRRRLEDWGDTLILSLASVSSTPDLLFPSLSWSVLLGKSK